MRERKERIFKLNEDNYLKLEAEKHELICENTNVREVFLEIFSD